MKKILFLVLLFIVPMFANAQSVQVPKITNLSTENSDYKAGEEIKGSFIVVNPTDKIIRDVNYSVGFSTDTPFDIVSKILPSDYFDLNPGETKEISFKTKAPSIDTEKGFVIIEASRKTGGLMNSIYKRISIESPEIDLRDINLSVNQTDSAVLATIDSEEDLPKDGHVDLKIYRDNNFSTPLKRTTFSFSDKEANIGSDLEPGSYTLYADVIVEGEQIGTKIIDFSIRGAQASIGVLNYEVVNDKTLNVDFSFSTLSVDEINEKMELSLDQLVVESKLISETGDVLDTSIERMQLSEDQKNTILLGDFANYNFTINSSHLSEAKELKVSLMDSNNIKTFDSYSIKLNNIPAKEPYDPLFIIISLVVLLAIILILIFIRKKYAQIAISIALLIVSSVVFMNTIGNRVQAETNIPMSFSSIASGGWFSIFNSFGLDGGSNNIVTVYSDHDGVYAPGDNLDDITVNYKRAVASYLQLGAILLPVDQSLITSSPSNPYSSNRPRVYIEGKLATSSYVPSPYNNAEVFHNCTNVQSSDVYACGSFAKLGPNSSGISGTMDSKMKAPQTPGWYYIPIATYLFDYYYGRAEGVYTTSICVTGAGLCPGERTDVCSDIDYGQYYDGSLDDPVLMSDVNNTPDNYGDDDTLTDYTVNSDGTCTPPDTDLNALSVSCSVSLDGLTATFTASPSDGSSYTWSGADSSGGNTATKTYPDGTTGVQEDVSVTVSKDGNTGSDTCSVDFGDGGGGSDGFGLSCSANPSPYYVDTNSGDIEFSLLKEAGYHWNSYNIYWDPSTNEVTSNSATYQKSSFENLADGYFNVEATVKKDSVSDSVTCHARITCDPASDPGDDLVDGGDGCSMSNCTSSGWVGSPVACPGASSYPDVEFSVAPSISPNCVANFVLNSNDDFQGNAECTLTGPDGSVISTYSVGALFPEGGLVLSDVGLYTLSCISPPDNDSILVGSGRCISNPTEIEK